MGFVAFKAAADRCGAMGKSPLYDVRVAHEAELLLRSDQAILLGLVVTAITVFLLVGRMNRTVLLDLGRLFDLGGVEFFSLLPLVILLAILFCWRKAGYAVKNGRRYFM